ncbi:MAG TPA: helix-turn-helix domain-containing protein [Thermoleophilia bacterium]|nr:helix-turn-helix domain-containing protein [Thermoleophilia bacterium]
MMGVPPKRKKPAAREGREVTTAAILDAAEELFAADGYEAVTVRAIAERAGVSHALVHRYLGAKAEIFRAVLQHNQGVMLAAAPDDPDILTAVSLILREGLIRRRRYVRLLADSALHGVPYAQTPGRFAAVDRLVELAEREVASASPDERTGDDLDPRFVIAAITALFLGWGATESWVLPAAGIADMDEEAVIDGLERVMLGILRDNLPGLVDEGPAVG